MIYIITNFYEKECSIKNTLFKKRKFTYYMFLTTPFIIMSSAIIQSLIIRNAIVNIIVCIAYIVVFIVSLIVFNETAKNQLYKQYGYEKEKGLWNTRKAVDFLSKKEKKKMKKYLKKNEVSFAKLKKYRKDMKKEIEKLKPKLVSVPTICGVMFITLYGVAITWAGEQISSLEVMIGFIVINLVIIIMVGGALSLLKDMYDLVVNSSVFAKNYNAMKRCIKVLDDIVFDKKESKS